MSTIVKIGRLVREKEGSRSGGLVLESRLINTERVDVLILWPDGSRMLYKSTFLEPIV